MSYHPTWNTKFSGLQRSILNTLGTMDALMKKLDRIFSLYIRNRGAVNGWNRCFTCHKPFRVEELDCGHFISRKHLSVRWDERNAFPQCRDCNRMQYGKERMFEMYLVGSLGTDVVDELKAKARQSVKLTRSDIIDMITLYESKLNTRP